MMSRLLADFPQFPANCWFRVFLFLLWPLLFGSIGFEVGADTGLNLKTVYYKIEGASVEELRQELDARTPISQGGERFHANTSWTVNWNMRWIEGSNSCKVIGVTTRINVMVHCPNGSTTQTLIPSKKRDGIVTTRTWSTPRTGIKN